MSAPVMNPTSRSSLSEELVRRLAAAMRAAQLYAPTHPLVAKSGTGLAELLTTMLANIPSLTIGIVGDDLVVADVPIPNAAENLGELMRRLRQSGVERVVFDRGATAEEVSTLVRSLASGRAYRCTHARWSNSERCCGRVD